MNNRFFSFIKEEAIKILYGCLFAIMLIGLLAILRAITVSTFLFVQIIFMSIVMLALTYFLSMSKWKIKRVHGNEIYLVLFAFTIASFLLLNVDRSRSVYLLKWVDATGGQGISLLEISAKANANDLGTYALNQRINEQIQSGNLTKDSKGILRTTSRGKVLNSLFKVTAAFLNLTGYHKA